MKFVTIAERPDLIESAEELTRDAFPEYNNHGDVLTAYWGRLAEEKPEFQFHLIGENDEILAAGALAAGALGRERRGSTRRDRRRSCTRFR